MTSVREKSAGAVDRLLRAPAPRTNVLEGLEVLEASDLPRWKNAVVRAKSLGYGSYFPFVLAHQRPRRTVLLGEDAGCLCVFKLKETDHGPRLDVLMAPMPMDVDVARRCLERANDYNGDRSARILRIDANDAALAGSIPGLRVHERRAQYLYAPQAFGDLSGGRFRTLRYHVSRVRRLQNLEVVPYTDSRADACRSLLEQWSERHRSQFGTSGDAGMSRRALALTGVLGAPDLVGELVLLDGRLVAYAFGGEIRPGVGCLYEAKTDLAVAGLTHFQFHSFLSKVDAFEVINGGSDARREGLRQVKDSLRPVGMHLEYRGVQVVT